MFLYYVSNAHQFFPYATNNFIMAECHGRVVGKRPLASKLKAWNIFHFPQTFFQPHHYIYIYIYIYIHISLCLL